MAQTIEDQPSLSELQQIQPQRLIQLFFKYILSDIAKRPRSFKIGLFSTYIVIAFLGLLQCLKSLSPFVFLQLAETSVGDTDLQFLPKNIANKDDFKLINITELRQYTSQINEFIDVSPRWLFMCDIHNPKAQLNLTSFFMILDSQLENSIGLGRRLDTDIITSNQIYISNSLQKGLNVQIGETIQIQFSVIEFLKHLGFNNTEGESKNNLRESFKKFLNDLLQISNDDILYRKFDVQTMLQYAKEYKYYVNDLEESDWKKNQTKKRFIQSIYSQNLTIQQKKLGKKIVDFLFARNMTQDAKHIYQFTLRLSSFTKEITILQIEDGLFDIAIEMAEFQLNFQVYKSVQSPKGKWTEALGMMVYMDYKNASNLFLDAILDRFDTVIKQKRKYDKGMAGAVSQLIPVTETRNSVMSKLKHFQLQEYSMMANVVFDNKYPKYETPQNVKTVIISSTNQFYSIAGYDYPVQIMAPLGFIIEIYHLLKHFIETLIQVATMILLMLSILLIYSLMIGDVDEKTYEFGMLRALGFRKSWLIGLLLLQALTFAIPGLLLALITCYLLNTLISMYIFDMSLLISSYNIPIYALILQLIIGICMPIISNILPIKQALSTALRDSLNLFHKVVNNIVVTVMRLEKIGISLNQTIYSIMLISIGFISYYIIPMNMIYQNFGVAIFVLNIVFITMLVGVTMIINLIQKLVEKLILYMILFIKSSDYNLKPIILNNLKCHENRNAKTTLMYSLGLSLIIFTGSSFAIMSQMMENYIKINTAADIRIFDVSKKFGLDEYRLKQQLEWEQHNDPSLIRDYTFSALPLNEFPGLPNHFYISPLSHFPRKSIRLQPVQQNLLNTIDIQYYQPTEYNTELEDVRYLDNGLRDGIYDLYNRALNFDIKSNKDISGIVSNSKFHQIFDAKYKKSKVKAKKLDREINIIIPEGYRNEGSLSVNTPALLTIKNKQYLIEKRLKIMHMATKIPNFDFSAYATIVFYGQGLITMKDAELLLKEIMEDRAVKKSKNYKKIKEFIQQLPKNLSFGLPKEQLFIKFKRETTKEERLDFCNRLRNYFTNDQIYLIDSQELMRTFDDVFTYFEIFNVVVAIIALTLSFFLLLISFISNVRNNCWEIGILRSIGLQEVQIQKVFIYEAVSLIVSSGFLGSLVGFTTASTFAMQIATFSESHFKLAFPLYTFLFTFLGGVLIALTSSYLAVRQLKNKEIASILKNQI
ncbi:unnamed protein product [Paramecium primaurelia]|uniref:ABC3 transporter permease C-terminal domain-containing protein n=1 Tax=Paramecium primaurelia TaxID=5886 RepID=A0A8S1NS95_PARPR|nr:unnamed protein product [Paramecium primaurelia]